MEVLVSAEDDAEVRRVSISNSGTRVREIDVTSYAELVLAPQAADVTHEPRPIVVPLEHRVLARDRDIVEEDIAVRHAPSRYLAGLEQEGRPGVRPTLHEKQSLSGLQAIMREWELVMSFIDRVDGCEGERWVLLQWSPALRAEERIITVAMSTAGTEHRQVPPRS